jgi:hypothetical protein
VNTKGEQKAPAQQMTLNVDIARPDISGLVFSRPRRPSPSASSLVSRRSNFLHQLDTSSFERRQPGWKQFAAAHLPDAHMEIADASNVII